MLVSQPERVTPVVEVGPICRPIVSLDVLGFEVVE